jgi:glutamate decarboxylase
MDPVKEINDALLKVKEEKGWDIPMHVDGASGGFIVPFLYPDMEWDFRLEQVRSINVSGHKYGLVYPGIGWLIFKNKNDIPEELVFNINYLGGSMPNYSLNFSKGSSTIIAQYYNFIRLGYKGYKSIMENMSENAKYLSKKLKETGKFEIINKNTVFPLVAVTLKDSNFTTYQLSDKLRERGWIIPAYTLPPNAEDITVLRMVIKETFSRDMVNMLFDDILDACGKIEDSFKEEHRKEDHSLLY